MAWRHFPFLAKSSEAAGQGRRWLESPLSPQAGAMMVGCTLLLSGCIKLRGLLFDRGPADALASSGLLYVVALLEVALALEWLLGTYPLVRVWRMTFMATWMFLACRLLGSVDWAPDALVATCGCFGGIRHEAIVRVVAIGVLFIGLLLCGGRCQSDSTASLAVKWRWLVLMGVALISWYSLRGMATGSWSKFATSSKPRLELQASQAMNQSPDGDWILGLDTVQAGSELRYDMEVKNAGAESVKLIGYWVDCSCISIDEFPVTVSSGNTASLRLRLRAPKSPGEYVFSIELYSDRIDYSRVRLLVECMVKDDAIAP